MLDDAGGTRPSLLPPVYAPDTHPTGVPLIVIRGDDSKLR